MKILLSVMVLLAGALIPSAGSAQTSYPVLLSGYHEVPSNASLGSGIGTVVLSADQTMITVYLSFIFLTAPAVAAHIHGPGGVGTNASVLFPFSGVPAATSGSIPVQSFSISATQVGYLKSGYLYMNIHSTTFPGGEIRGQVFALPLITGIDYRTNFVRLYFNTQTRAIYAAEQRSELNSGDWSANGTTAIGTNGVGVGSLDLPVASATRQFYRISVR